MKPKIIFFGSDQYASIVLKTLQKDKHFEIIKVITSRKDLLKVKLVKPQPDIGALASFGTIVPKEILSFPKKGVLNIHPSLLPKYRGPSPVQAAILAGDKQTGVTIIKLDEKIDHGPVVAQFAEDIRPNDTAKSLYQRLFAQGIEVLKTILPAYLKGQIETKPQNHRLATYTKKLTRDDGKIDWQNSADYNERFIRAMSPWPGAWTFVKLVHLRDEPQAQHQLRKTKRLKILKAHLKNKKLVLDTVQLEGKKPVTFKQFNEGYREAKIIS